jgi:hypothetical protein
MASKKRGTVISEWCNFEEVRDLSGRLTGAKCNFCKEIITNTGAKRMESHL